MISMNTPVKDFDYHYRIVSNSIRLERKPGGKIKIDIEDTLESAFSCLGCFGLLFSIILYVLHSKGIMVWFSWFYIYWFAISLTGFFLRKFTDNYYLYDRESKALIYHVSFFFLTYEWTWVELSPFDRLAVSMENMNRPADESEFPSCQFLFQFTSVPDIRLGSRFNIPENLANSIGQKLAEEIGIEFLPGSKGVRAPKRYIDGYSKPEELVELAELSNTIPLLIETHFNTSSLTTKFTMFSAFGGFLGFLLDLLSIVPGLKIYCPIFFLAFIIFLSLDIVHVSYYILLREKGVMVFCRRWLKLKTISIFQQLSDLDALEAECVVMPSRISYHYSLVFRDKTRIKLGVTQTAETLDEVHHYGKAIASGFGISYKEPVLPVKT